MKNKTLTLKNPRTGELWLCKDFTNRRVVDGVEFIEVNQPGSSRLVWISLAALVKVRQDDLIKK